MSRDRIAIQTIKKIFVNIPIYSCNTILHCTRSPADIYNKLLLDTDQDGGL